MIDKERRPHSSSGKKLNGSSWHLEMGYTGSGSCGRKRGSCKEAAVQQSIIWRDMNKRAAGDGFGLQQELQFPVHSLTEGGLL